MSAAPFTILVIADLSQRPHSTRLRHRRLITVTPQSLPSLRHKIDPPDPLSPEWLGLAMLANAAAPFSNVRVKVWDVSKRDLLKDFQRAAQPDQSAFFLKVSAENLDTFGAEPIGLILADFELAAGPEDPELAMGLQFVSASAEAATLVGTSFERTVHRHLFPLAPRWSTPEHPEKPIHPGYPVAASAAAALRSGELEDAAANLLPAWSPPRAATFAATSLSQPDAFLSITSVGQTLAHVLLTGMIVHRLQAHIRTTRINDSGAALARAVQEWFAAERLANLRHVDIVPGKLQAVIAWHPNAGGFVQQIELRAPGIQDERA